MKRRYKRRCFFYALTVGRKKKQDSRGVLLLDLMGVIWMVRKLTWMYRD
jgi:hypothetical protein